MTKISERLYHMISNSHWGEEPEILVGVVDWERSKPFFISPFEQQSMKDE